MDKFKNSEYIIQTGHKIVSEISFPSDFVEIKNYIAFLRLNTNDIKDIAMLSSKKDISSTIHVQLNNWTPTSISIERSFSMLKNY